MPKSNIIYQSKETVYARERRYGEWIEYSAVVTIKDSGKKPVSINMTLDSVLSLAIDLPRTIKVQAENLTQAYSSVARFFDRYGFEFR